MKVRTDRFDTIIQNWLKSDNENMTEAEFNEVWKNTDVAGKAEIIRLTTGNHAFRLTYRNDPEAWLYDIPKWNKKRNQYPTRYQAEILANIPIKKRVAAVAPHGTGKSALAAFAFWWFVTTRDRDEDWKVPTTASAWRQLIKYLWPEIHKWASKMDYAKIGVDPYRRKKEILDQNVKLHTGEGFAVASDNHELIEGAHADSIFYIFDESKAIPDPTWDAAEGAFSTAGEGMYGEAFALAISTPGESIGRFFDIMTRKPGFDDWWPRSITLEEAVGAGRISQDWADQRKKQWGATSSIYKRRVLGQFAQDDEDSVIPLDLIEKAVRRHDMVRHKSLGLKTKIMGVDVARMGDDKTVFAYRCDNIILGLEKHAKKDTMETTGLVMGRTQAGKDEIEIIVDSIGVGAGVFDRLRELGRKVFGINVSERIDAMDKTDSFGFANIRSAMWWRVRELLEDDTYALELPDDEGLIGDLAAPKYVVTSAGKIKVESKEDIKKRLGKSTDEADAVCQAFWETPAPGMLI